MVVTQPPTLLHVFQLFPSASLSALPLSFLPLTESSLSRSSHSLAARSGSSLLQRTHLLSLSATSSSCCEVSSMASTPPLHNQMRCLWQIRGKEKLASMDCCVCTTMPLILRPPRNTICGACYEGVRSIINMMSNVESEKVKAMANPNPNSSPVSRRNSSKTLDDCIRWCSEQMEQFNQQKEDLVFLRGFVSAFKAQIHTDILVSPGRHGPPIPAHKSVLGARSEIFKNMLECDECKAAPSNSITIPDLNHEELESLLEFLYSGTLGVEKLEKHVYALSQAADKYVIPHLLKHCERYLLSSLSTSNALETLEIADTCSNHNLKETTLNFLVKNIEHMVPSPKFETFVHRSPHLTVQLVTRAFVNGAK